MNRSSSHVVGFGVFEADLRERELRKHGIRIRLQDKPFEILALLLERPGELVTREELQQKLWPGAAYGDFDHSLSIAVHKLRLALNDTAEAPRFIATEPRRGYRFLAPVRRASLDAQKSKLMLLVLPFDNLNNDPDQEYFAEGLTEEMITHLGRLKPQQLGVIARTTAMQYKRAGKLLKEIAAELGVDYLLEGGVRRSKNKVRITAQLIQLSDETHLWAETYDRPLRDVLEIQADVASRIAGSLALELLPASQTLGQRTATRNSEAHELYLRGRYHWNKRVEEHIAKAIEYYSRAIETDQNFAPPYAGLADAYIALGFYGALAPGPAFERARTAATRALQIDSTVGEAHTSLGFVILAQDWDWPLAEKEHLRALELNSNHAPSHHWYGLNLMMAARYDEAFAAFERARALDPLSAVANSHMAWMFYFMRQYGRSIELLRNTIDLDPTFAPAYFFLSLPLIQWGREEEAVTTLRKALELSAGHPLALGALGFAYGTFGRNADMTRVVEQLKALSKVRGVAPYSVAFALAGSPSRKDELFEWLERAFESRSPWMMLLAADPAFDRLRGDPRFDNLVRRSVPYPEQRQPSAGQAKGAGSGK